MNRKNITEFIVTSIAKYPYIIAFFICILINPFFFCSKNYIPINTINIIATAFIVIVIASNYSRYKTRKVSLGIFVLLSLLEIFSILLISFLYFKASNKLLWLFVGFCILLYIFYYLADKSKYKLQITCLLIVGISFSLYFCFILAIPIHLMQHDVGVFGNLNSDNNGGHAPYIEYIQKNYSLPKGDVSKTWQFAQPPLHHIICAIWLEINEKAFNIDKSHAQESLQILSLFYVICIIISAYKIFRYFKLSEISLLCSLTITCFSPAFILLSININNDVLSVAFITGAMLNTLYWKRDKSLRNILKIALCFGLGMMTKVSTAMLAPALFVFFVYTYVNNNNKRELLKQFIIFLIISLPIGTWFNIKNYLKYKIPFNFVHQMNTIQTFEPQYIGDVSFFNRITDFSLDQLNSVFVYNKQFGSIRNDYNPLITLIKTALFDEYIRDLEKLPILNIVSLSLFWLFVFLTIFSIFSMVYISLLSIKQKCYIEEIFFMVIFFITLIFSVYMHSYNVPYVAGMNFRFITPTIIIAQLFCGLFNQYSKFKIKNYFNNISMVLSISFAIFTTIIYTMFMIIVNINN